MMSKDALIPIVYSHILAEMRDDQESELMELNI